MSLAQATAAVAAGPPAPAPLAAALAALRAGRPIVLLDPAAGDAGGLAVALADRIGADVVTFMACECRGIVSLALSPARSAELGLRTQPSSRIDPEPAQLVSIEATRGVTTGISAADRARTLRVAAAPAPDPAALVSPGHIVPLRTSAGGAVARRGLEEAAVDLALMAGATDAAAICLVLDDAGDVAGPVALRDFARRHRLEAVTFDDVLASRQQSPR